MPLWFYLLYDLLVNFLSFFFFLCAILISLTMPIKGNVFEKNNKQQKHKKTFSLPLPTRFKKKKHSPLLLPLQERWVYVTLRHRFAAVKYRMELNTGFIKDVWWSGGGVRMTASTVKVTPE